jgi:hypothetical protein
MSTIENKVKKYKKCSFWSKSRSDFDTPDSADQNLLRNSTPFFTVLLFSKNIILRKMGGIRRQSYK